jgi:hypothetical protein
MDQVAKASFRSRRKHRSLARQADADSHAFGLIPIIRELTASGLISRKSLAERLNRRDIPTARGGRWHYTTVVRVLRRGGLLTPGKGAKWHNGQAGKRAADAIAQTLAPTIRDLQTSGLVSCSAIARELNQRGVPTAKGSEWRSISVRLTLAPFRKAAAGGRCGFGTSTASRAMMAE